MKITLCGSTRFREAFSDWNIILTLGGHLVYGLGGFGREITDVGKPVENILVNDEQKRRLDLIHLAKISESDAVVILNVDGYVGESTRRELEWAKMHKKEVYYLENARPTFLGPTVWSLYNLFDQQPISTIPWTAKYTEKPEPAAGFKFPKQTEADEDGLGRGFPME